MFQAAIAQSQDPDIFVAYSNVDEIDKQIAQETAPVRKMKKELYSQIDKTMREQGRDEHSADDHFFTLEQKTAKTPLAAVGFLAHCYKTFQEKKQREMPELEDEEFAKHVEVKRVENQSKHKKLKVSTSRSGSSFI
jgi:hypothetical protein